MNALVQYSPPPAVAAAWEKRGYPSLALMWHAEAMERRSRMHGPVIEPATAKPVWRDYQPQEPILERQLTHLDSAKFYREAHAILDPLLNCDIPPVIRIPHGEIIKRVVVREWGNVSYYGLIGNRRTKDVTIPRQVAMSIHRWLVEKDSWPVIGRSYSGRDHTTVIHAIKATGVRMNANPEFAARVERVRLACELAIMKYETGRARTRHERGSADQREAAQPSPKGSILERSEAAAEQDSPTAIGDVADQSGIVTGS